jgi:hypothetical protein
MHKVIQDIMTLKNQNAKEWGWAIKYQFPWTKELGGKTRSKRFHPTFNTISYRLRYNTVGALYSDNSNDFFLKHYHVSFLH